METFLSTLIVFSIIISLYLSSRVNASSIIMGYVSFFICILSIILLIIPYLKLEYKPYVEDIKPYSVEYIESLGDSNLVNGKSYGVFIRSGYISEDMYYQYMVKLPDGGFVYNKVDAEDAKIYYTDGDDSRIEWYNKHKSYWWVTQEEVSIKIYIPKGSISEEFSVDLN